MKKGLTEVYCGTGRGKTALAIGQSLYASAQGKSVIIIQFLKGREQKNLDFLENLDNLDIKIFRFEKRCACYEELTEQEKDDEKRNILNGLNFARKVVATHECDWLLLDEILGVLDCGITSAEAIADILKLKGEGMHIILTGRSMPPQLKEFVDSVTTLVTEETDPSGSEGEQA